MIQALLLLLAFAAGSAAVLAIIIEIAHMPRPLKRGGFHVRKS